MDIGVPRWVPNSSSLSGRQPTASKEVTGTSKDRHWVSGFEWAWGSGVQGLGLRDQGFRGSGFRAKGSGVSGIQGLGLMVQWFRA